MAVSDIDFGNGDDPKDINGQQGSQGNGSGEGAGGEGQQGGGQGQQGQGTGEGEGGNGQGTQGGEGSGSGEGQQGNGGEGSGSGEGNQDLDLKVGDSIEFEDNVYTVAENGDLVDKDGKVFKPAAEVKDWLATLEVPDNDEITIDNIREAFSQDIVDDKGNPVEFENSVEGIKSYMTAVVEQRVKEAEEAAINTLYANNPLLKQFKDYVDVTGSYEGFGQLPDRESWEINKDNEAQQEAIIRMAAAEFGNKSINDSYIQYLKDSGSLYDVAVEQLDALKEQDKQLRENIAAQAEEARKAQQKEVTEYWNKVNNIIKSRTIAGYKVPDSITKEIDGKKVILTPDDFYNYLSKQVYTNANGQKISAYQKDLEEKSDDEFINNELINAWLMFTGGSFKDLAQMAVKENEVRKLKLVSKQHKTASPVKVNKKTPSKLNPDDVLF